MKKEKKAVSPIISTVLLIMIVVIIAIIIIIWSQGFIKEIILKEVAGESKRIEQFCGEVGLRTILNPDETVGFQNTGNVPIYGYRLKLEGGGNSEIHTFEGGNNIVNPGFSKMINYDGDGNPIVYGNWEQISVIPILLGESRTGSIQPFECPEINGFVV
jgi:flagellin-like protein